MEDKQDKVWRCKIDVLSQYRPLLCLSASDCSLSRALRQFGWVTLLVASVVPTIQAVMRVGKLHMYIWIDTCGATQSNRQVFDQRTIVPGSIRTAAMLHHSDILNEFRCNVLPNIWFKMVVIIIKLNFLCQLQTAAPLLFTTSSFPATIYRIYRFK